MIYCPVVKMPDYFTRLLRGNMQPAGELFRSLAWYVQEHSALEALVHYSFADIDPKGRVDYFIKNLGWLGFRNRLCSVFLFYAEHSFFPSFTTTDSVDRIAKLEEMYKTIQVPNYSRVFLLAFYLELLSRQKSAVRPSPQTIPTIGMIEKLYPLFGKYSQSKVVKLDIVILVLLHLVAALGVSEVDRLMDQGLSYDLIVEKMPVSAQEQMIANLLNYGASVGEEEIFCSRMV